MPERSEGHPLDFAITSSAGKSKTETKKSSGQAQSYSYSNYAAKAEETGNYELASRVGETPAQHKAAKDRVHELGLPGYLSVTTKIEEFLNDPGRFLQEIYPNPEEAEQRYYLQALRSTGEREYCFDLADQDETVFYLQELLAGRACKKNELGELVPTTEGVQFDPSDTLIVSTFKRNERGTSFVVQSDGKITFEGVDGDLSDLDYGKKIPDVIGSYENGQWTMKPYGSGEWTEESWQQAVVAIKKAAEMIPLDEGGKPKLPGRYSVIHYRGDQGQLEPNFLDILRLEPSAGKFYEPLDLDRVLRGEDVGRSGEKIMSLLQEPPKLWGFAGTSDWRSKTNVVESGQELVESVIEE